MRRRSVIKWICAICAVILIAGTAVFLADYFNFIPKEYYSAGDFGIETVHSSVDYNKNGVDDYTDIMLGARLDALNKPVYDPSYFEGGYPPDDAGVCTDVIWRAFREAGYNFKDMVDSDIRDNTEIYPRVEGKPDPNIDFRRVPNLMVFFERYAVSLTLDPYEINEWQPGDIVTFGTTHIAVISDRRNRKGIPHIIHNSSLPNYEEDGLTMWRNGGISGHFRFDASRLDESDLIRWE